MYYVYIHTTPDNKKYVGMSVNPLKRWNKGEGYINNERFYKAIKRYGWDNIRHEIAFEYSNKRDAEHKEAYLIEKYNSDNKEYGYNIHDGCRKVVAFRKDGTLLAIYNSVQEASKITKIPTASIINCIKKKYKTAGGYIWEQL